MKHDILMAVKELMERNWNLTEIAIRLRIDPDIVRIAMDIIEDLLT